MRDEEKKGRVGGTERAQLPSAEHSLAGRNLFEANLLSAAVPEKRLSIGCSYVMNPLHVSPTIATRYRRPSMTAVHPNFRPVTSNVPR